MSSHLNQLIVIFSINELLHFIFCSPLYVMIIQQIEPICTSLDWLDIAIFTKFLRRESRKQNFMRHVFKVNKYRDHLSPRDYGLKNLGLILSQMNSCSPYRDYNRIDCASRKKCR